MEPVRARAGYFRLLWREGVWGKWIGLAYSLAGLYVFIRDEFWRPTNTTGKWSIINMIPHLSLAWWFFGADSYNRALDF